MADIKLSITFDLGAKLDMMAVVNKQVFPLLHQAVDAVGKQTVANWQHAVYTAKLWSGEKDAYAKSITWQMTGDFSGFVEATYEHAEEIEHGRPARDLKKMLNTSKKVRVSNKGVRYLSIPFRHNTPGNDALAKSMPTSVFAMAKALEASMVVGQTTRPSGQKGMQHLSVPQNVYKWGGRLPAGLTPKLKDHHATDVHAGMVRFDTSTPGGAKSSTYLTFRTMSEKSNGWIVPPQPGQKIAEGVVNGLQPKAQMAFQQAIKRTLAKG